MNQNQALHENQYQNLRSNGSQGWGAEKFQYRINQWQQTVNKLVASSTFPPKGSKILELGCGAGDGLLPFAALGYDVTGVDFSKTAIQWACEKFSKNNLNGNFINADIRDLSPFHAAQFTDHFDAVIDGACLHCVIGPDRKKVLREVHRTLKPRGFFLVSHMTNDPKELPLNTVFDPPTRTQIFQNIPYRFMPTSNQLETELIESSFNIIQHEVRHNTWWDHSEIWCSKKTPQK